MTEINPITKTVTNAQPVANAVPAATTLLNTSVITIDATGLIVGRLAAYVAKKAITGTHVEIVNIEKAVISGNPKQIIEVWAKRRTMTNHANPEEASKWPRKPDLMFKKILSGMTPFGRRGKEALARVKAYLGPRDKINGTKPVKDSSKLKRGFISLADLCKALGGWNKG
ncbi:MAG: uL13 family ribosomal protein [Candidatus Micrarchaeota archaeon]|nr:uL13 family ribosomal protein [Candidatus Micrarchaeota archaeon]